MQGTLPRVQDIHNLKGKRVLVRASLNVPFAEDGSIGDDFRLQKALPTIQYLKNHDAKVIIIGHVGREPKETLRPVYEYFKKYIDLTFVEDVCGPEVAGALRHMQNGDVVLLENLRRDAGEKKNDAAFARELAGYADCYVNDAFSVAHRSHASIVGIPEHLPSYAGMLFFNEYERLSYARNPDHPALFILGGAKFETKQPLIEKFLTIYDHVFVTGALANDFFLAEGYEVGRSLVSKPPVNVRHLLENQKILLPVDVAVLTALGERVIKKPDEVQPDEMINDIGPETVQLLKPIIQQAHYILWNGPTGDYQKGFSKGSESIARLIDASEGDAIVGGGDTMSIIESNDLVDAFSFCSTAGGSMLEFLHQGTLPGIEAIKQSPRHG